MQISANTQISKNCFISVLILAAFGSFAQIKFERGYFIDNQNKRIECLIKNQDWDDNPTHFKFKLSDTAVVQTASVNAVNEFEIFGSSKYVKADVKIDRSPTNLADLTFSKEPVWSREQLFLKVLLRGKASLYYYSGGKNLIRFFYSVSDKPVQQLIYKKYFAKANEQQYTEQNTTTKINYGFRQQLWIDVRCEHTQKNVLETITYDKKELIKYFKNYSNCLGDSSIEYGTQVNKGREFFNLSLTPGINFAAVVFGNGQSPQNETFEFKKQLDFRIGVEAEFILPFHKNKWAIAIEPYYKNFKIVTSLEGTDSIKIDFKAIELSLGLKHYFFLNRNAKLFLSLIVNSGIGLNFNSEVEYDYYYQPLVMSSNFNFGIGTGLSYKRLSAEFRYYTTQDLLSAYGNYYCTYNNISFILAYKFLKVKHK